MLYHQEYPQVFAPQILKVLVGKTVLQDVLHIEIDPERTIQLEKTANNKDSNDEQTATKIWQMLSVPFHFVN